MQQVFSYVKGRTPTRTQWSTRNIAILLSQGLLEYSTEISSLTITLGCGGCSSSRSMFEPCPATSSPTLSSRMIEKGWNFFSSASMVPGKDRDTRPSEPKVARALFFIVDLFGVNPCELALTPGFADPRKIKRYMGRSKGKQEVTTLRVTSVPA